MGLSSLTFHYVEQPGPDYASDLRLYVAYMFSTAAWCSGARRVADQRNRRSAGCRGVGETGFEVGDAPVLEAQGGAGGFEAFVEGAVVGGELPDALFECGVLGGDALDRILSPLGFQVSDAAKEFSATRALGEDFGVGGFECVLGVEGAFAPARLIPVVASGGELFVALTVLPDCVGRLSARHARRPLPGGHVVLLHVERTHRAPRVLCAQFCTLWRGAE